MQGGNIMYTVKADKFKNRLYISLTGFLKPEEVKEAADAVIREAKLLQSGFGVINDISQSKPTSQEATKELVRAQSFLKTAGAGQIVRVVSKENIIAGVQLKRTGKEAGYE